VYKVLAGKPEGRRPLGRPRRRWEHGIGMDHNEINCRGRGVVWIQLNQDRVNTAMNFRVVFFFPEDGVGLVPKRGCLLTLAYYAFPRYQFWRAMVE
jgi:hypothetical protein